MPKAKKALEKPEHRAWRNRIVGHGEEDADQLLANPKNWRVHPKAQQSALEGVLKEVGWVQQVIVNRVTGFVVDGHARVAMAISRGEKVPVVYVELTKEEEALVLATLDPLSAMAGTDDELLADLKSGMSEAYLGLHAATDADLMGRPKDQGEVPDAQIDRAEELLEKWKVERGQIWQIGRHRLLCGDCTSRQDVLALMQGQRAGLMNTDPPYGVKLRLEDNHEASNSAKGIKQTYRHFESIMGDDLEGEKLQEFLEKVFRVAVEVLAPNAAWYLWHAQLSQGFFAAAAAAAAAAQLLVHRQIIWVKPHFVFGRGDYHWRHELCFYGWIKGNRPEFLGERNQSTVWQLEEGGGSIRKDQNHPTQKPVELFTIPISNHLRPGGLAYEPFAGSGSQFVASEQSGVCCYGLEIEPKYCAVILERLSAMGLTPELTDDRSGAMRAGDRELAGAVA